LLPQCFVANFNRINEASFTMGMTLGQLDQRYVWHPFTQMRDWARRKPIVLVSGQGATLRDEQGREYLDGNSSIWTNLHGHNHPKLNAAIGAQLGKIAHSSALGLANEPAARLAEKLVKSAAMPSNPLTGRSKVHSPLTKVFFSDDGSTAMEVALKLAYEFTRRTGRSQRPRFVSLDGAYHGDTVGAVALGHIDLFHKAYSQLLFKTDRVMAPYCYRCPFNRAKPERADAREYRKCNSECIGQLEKKFASQSNRGNPYAGFVFEPIIQGAAGMIAQPKGWLSHATKIAVDHGALLIADEVMTGFGRTGGASKSSRSSPLFACQSEGVQPDFIALAKGLTGGYLPMAATLTTEQIFESFLGEYEEFKTFFHGHSYTGNQLGASAALASLSLLQTPDSIRARHNLETWMRQECEHLWAHPNIGDIRQAGLIVGVELVKNWRTKEPFPLRERAGIRVCEVMAELGVLTRPIGNVIVLMPPYCVTREEINKLFSTLSQALTRLFGKPGSAGVSPKPSRIWS
jgi:adenosylmethionine-8-amino-7-oxononanoate aminotransferase